MKRSLRRALGYVAAILIMWAFWEISSLLFHNPALPPPALAFRQFVEQFPVLLPHFWYSAFRVVSATGIGLVLGAPLGLVLGRSPRADVIADPLISLNYPIPKAVFLPVLLALFAIGSPSIIPLIAIIVFFQILLTARDAARSIPAASVLSVRSLGANPWQVFTNVIVPGTLPEIFTALRIGAGTAVAVLFFAEATAGSTGLGYYVFDAWGRIAYDQMFAGILGMALLGVLLYETIQIAEARLCRWERAGR